MLTASRVNPSASIFPNAAEDWIQGIIQVEPHLNLKAQQELPWRIFLRLFSHQDSPLRLRELCFCDQKIGFLL